MNKKNKNHKPLTLDALASYNQEVLFPALEERLVAKTDFNELKTDFHESKKEFKDFKNESLTNQDAMLKKLDILRIRRNCSIGDILISNCGKTY